MLLLLCLVRSKHHFKILGSKVHLRKSSSLRRCHYDSSPSLSRLLGSKGVLGAVCVHHHGGRLGGRRQMQAIARRATSPTSSSNSHSDQKYWKSAQNCYSLDWSWKRFRQINMKFPKNYLSMSLNETHEICDAIGSVSCIHCCIEFLTYCGQPVDIWRKMRLHTRCFAQWAKKKINVQ